MIGLGKSQVTMIFPEIKLPVYGDGSSWRAVQDYGVVTLTKKIPHFPEIGVILAFFYGKKGNKNNAFKT